MVTMTFKIDDDDYRNIETHKWNTRDWERIEKTISYLRRKYGQPRGRTITEPDTSWVQE